MQKFLTYYGGYGTDNMPKKMHVALKRTAKKKGLTGERKNRYIYGTLAKYESPKKKRKK